MKFQKNSFYILNSIYLRTCDITNRQNFPTNNGTIAFEKNLNWFKILNETENYYLISYQDYIKRPKWQRLLRKTKLKKHYCEILIEKNLFNYAHESACEIMSDINERGELHNDSRIY